MTDEPGVKFQQGAGGGIEGHGISAGQVQAVGAEEGGDLLEAGGVLVERKNRAFGDDERDAVEDLAGALKDGEVVALGVGFQQTTCGVGRTQLRPDRVKPADLNGETRARLEFSGERTLALVGGRMKRRERIVGLADQFQMLRLLTECVRVKAGARTGGGLQLGVEVGLRFETVEVSCPSGGEQAAGELSAIRADIDRDGGTVQVEQPAQVNALDGISEGVQSGRGGAAETLEISRPEEFVVQRVTGGRDDFKTAGPREPRDQASHGAGRERSAVTMNHESGGRGES